MFGVLLATVALLAVAPASAQDPVKVGAKLSEARITVGATTTLQISIETHGETADEIGVPVLPVGLEIISTSDYSQAQLRVPGGTSLIRRRELIIHASAPGAYRINSAVVRVGRTYHRTQPLDLIVTGSPLPSSTSRGGNSTLRVSLQPQTVYVGQQVLLLAEVTFAEEARARQSRPPTFDPPAPGGFWIQDVPDPISVRLRVAEGRSVETQTYRRVYFPLSAGEFRFPPARLQYDVRRGFLYPPESRELTSDSARLRVLPLPAAGQPAGFNGAVGRLAMSASLVQDRVRTGDPAVLNVEISGTGNVKALPQPVLPTLSDADVFSPSQESTVEVIDDQVGGMKRFRWLVVPKKPGVLVIPPIEYSVFDPERRTYVVLRSDTLRITATAVIADASADTSFRPLRAVARPEQLSWVRTPVFAAAQVLPLLLLATATAVRRRRNRAPTPADHVRTARRAVASLDTASHAFLTDLLHTLCDAAVAVTGGNERDPVQALRDHGMVEEARELDALQTELRRLRYAPSEPFDAESLRSRADALLRTLAPRSRGQGPAAASVMGLLLLFAFHGAAQDPLFEDAVSAYNAGDFVLAASTFGSYARAHPGQGDAWYNHGLASYRAGDRGRAVWSWLRAARYAPRDPDIRHNLEVAGARPALTRVLPLDRLAVPERLFTAAAGWWVLMAGVISVTIGYPRPGRVIALTGAAVVAFTALTAATGAITPDVVTPLRSGAVMYASPSTRDDTIGSLPVGSVARIISAGTGWLRVRTADGIEAWVESADVASP